MSTELRNTAAVAPEEADSTALFQDRVRKLIETGRLAENPTIFAYYIIWEPGNWMFAPDMRRDRWDVYWRKWLDERYGGVENAEKDWDHPAPRRDGLIERRRPSGRAGGRTRLVWGKSKVYTDADQEGVVPSIASCVNWCCSG